MPIKISAAVISCVTLLAGCDTRPLNELTYAEQQEMLKTFTATCAAAGVAEQSPEYRTCVQTEINAENAKRARQTAGLDSFGSGMSALGDSYSSAATVNRPVTCTTRPPVGWGSATTTCY